MINSCQSCLHCQDGQHISIVIHQSHQPVFQCHCRLIPKLKILHSFPLSQGCHFPERQIPWLQNKQSEMKKLSAPTDTRIQNAKIGCANHNSRHVPIITHCCAIIAHWTGHDYKCYVHGCKGKFPDQTNSLTFSWPSLTFWLIPTFR